MAGCATQGTLNAPTATPLSAQATPPPSAVEPTLETSHVYLLSPGKDAVQIVVSR